MTDIEADDNELSTVFKNLLYWHRAVKSEETSKYLTSRSLEMMNYSCWLTTANEIQSFCVAFNKTSAVLKEIVEYITNVCILVRFANKKECDFTNGPKQFSAFYSQLKNYLLEYKMSSTTYFKEMCFIIILKTF